MSKVKWNFVSVSNVFQFKVMFFHCKQLCGGMEIPCMLMFSFLSKAKINQLKTTLGEQVAG